MSTQVPDSQKRDPLDFDFIMENMPSIDKRYAGGEVFIDYTLDPPPGQKKFPYAVIFAGVVLALFIIFRKRG